MGVKKEESPKEERGNKRRENIESRETKHIATYIFTILYTSP